MQIKPAKRIQAVKSYYFAQKLPQVRALDTPDLPVINLGIGSPDMAPDERVIHELGAFAQMTSSHGYQSYRGIADLRSAFAGFYERHFGVSLDPEREILPLIGSKEGIMHLSMSILDPGDSVMVPDPGYPAYRMTAEIAGARTIFYPLRGKTDWQIDVSSLDDLIDDQTKMLWLNYPHMPTGAKMETPRIEELIKWALERNILLCHDNPYTFIRNHHPRSIMEFEGAQECAVELISLSKSHNMAGWRVGAMIGKNEILEMVMRFKSNMDSGQFLPVQRAAIEALQCEDDWYRKINKVYHKRSRVAREILDLLGCVYKHAQAGLFIWAKAPESITDVETWLDDILIQTHVFMTPGKIFGAGGDRYIRLSLCNCEADLAEAKNRITKFMNHTS